MFMTMQEKQILAKPATGIQKENLKNLKSAKIQNNVWNFFPNWSLIISEKMHG